MNIDSLKNRAKKAVESFVSASSDGSNLPNVFIIPRIEVDTSDPRYAEYFKIHPNAARTPTVTVPEFTDDEVLKEWRKQHPDAPALNTVIILPDNGRGDPEKLNNGPVDFRKMR